MFRKLSEGLASASDRIASALGSSSDESNKVRQLTALGFDEAIATQALRATSGDVDRAADLLLASSGAPTEDLRGGSAGLAIGPGDHPRRDRDDEEVMRQVLQQSVDDENRRRQQQQSSASRRAGEAALARAEARSNRATGRAKTTSPTQASSSPSKAANPSTSQYPPLASVAEGGPGPLSAHHPGVKVIPKLQDKSKEEQVLRCADRLKSSPLALDALHRALATIRDNPRDDKYRTVDKSAAGYKRSLESAPGAEDMLLAMSFRRHGNNELVLERSMVDPALLYLGISALEQAKLSNEYLQGKRTIAFGKELAHVLALGDSSEAEAIKRSQFLGRCPSEPEGGRGAVMQVKLADHATIRRRFDADDTLNDVLNWLGAHGSVIPDRIATREWSLVDLNHYPVSPVDPGEAHLTLQYLGCWPSGKLELLPSTDEWKEGAKTARRTSRGLGSAPSDAL